MCRRSPARSDARPSIEREALRYDAVHLFAERAELARKSFRLTSEELGAVVEVCIQLDGIPLAIELAAAKLAMLSVDELAARLEDRFSLLRGGSRTALPRHRTLEATIDWSYRLLTEPEQRMFSRLAVFNGGFTLDAAEPSARPLRTSSATPLRGRDFPEAPGTFASRPRGGRVGGVTPAAHERHCRRQAPTADRRRAPERPLPDGHARELRPLPGSRRGRGDRIGRRAACAFAVSARACLVPRRPEVGVDLHGESPERPAGRPAALPYSR